MSTRQRDLYNKIDRVFFFHIITETVREKSIQYNVQPKAKTLSPFEKSVAKVFTQEYHCNMGKI